MAFHKDKKIVQRKVHYVWKIKKGKLDRKSFQIKISAIFTSFFRAGLECDGSIMKRGLHEGQKWAKE